MSRPQTPRTATTPAALLRGVLPQQHAAAFEAVRSASLAGDPAAAGAFLLHSDLVALTELVERLDRRLALLEAVGGGVS